MLDDKAAALKRIIDFGAVNLAKSYPLPFEDCCGWVLYHYENNSKALPNDIRVLVSDWGGQIDDGVLFDSKANISIEYHKGFADFVLKSDYQEEVLLFGGLMYAKKKFGISTDVKTLIRLMYAQEKSANAMVKMSSVMNLLQTDATENDLITFCGFAAVKSLLGKKSYVKAAKAQIHSRMFGFMSLHRPFTERQMHYAKRWQIDKLLFTLEESFGIRIYSKKGLMRGMLISTKLDYPQLKKIAEESNLKYRMNQLKKLKHRE